MMLLSWTWRTWDESIGCNLIRLDEPCDYVHVVFLQYPLVAAAALIIVIRSLSVLTMTR